MAGQANRIDQIQQQPATAANARIRKHPIKGFLVKISSTAPGLSHSESW